MIEVEKVMNWLQKASEEMRKENRNGWPVVCDEAASLIESLCRERDEAREALSPFARYGETLRRDRPQQSGSTPLLYFPVKSPEDPLGLKYDQITHGDYLRAAQVVRLPTLLEEAARALAGEDVQG